MWLTKSSKNRKQKSKRRSVRFSSIISLPFWYGSNYTTIRYQEKVGLASLEHDSTASTIDLIPILLAGIKFSFILPADLLRYFLCIEDTSKTQQPMIIHNNEYDDKKDPTKRLMNQSSSFQLPQPNDPIYHLQYQYVIGEEIERKFFPNLPELNKDQVVWICKSKGRKKKTSTNHKKIQLDNDTTNFTTSHSNTNNSESLSSIRCHHQRRHELFVRAKILDPTIRRDIGQTHTTDDSRSGTNTQFLKDERVLVQYPGGSTYYVNMNHIRPILHPTSDDSSHNHIVVVWPETDLYRSCCMIHCVPGYDSFIEIGCDEGELVYKMSQSMKTSTNISPKNHDSNAIVNGVGEYSENNTVVLGIDKSKSSITIARQRYPHCSFHVCDVLDDEPTCWPIPRNLYRSTDRADDDHQQQQQTIVIAIDINGNREIQQYYNAYKLL